MFYKGELGLREKDNEYIGMKEMFSRYLHRQILGICHQLYQKKQTLSRKKQDKKLFVAQRGCKEFGKTRQIKGNSFFNDHLKSFKLKLSKRWLFIPIKFTY